MEDITDAPKITANDLPMAFKVKYLGYEPAKGLWGIKHTRAPVNKMVERAKNLPANTILPQVTVKVTLEGLSFKTNVSKECIEETRNFNVDTISYGVQDLVYTRVFCIIVVKEGDLNEGLPFVCHAFACESKSQARSLTYSLAAAFQSYGLKVKASNGKLIQKKFAIDLRTPQEIQKDEVAETDA
ncbi:PREDICTED: uncharacterized protein LOC108564026 [Nicrophorus vespilloides]|uniref:Uncharacterized protein LOC108564026 n=1 Tax=Nicrophorus vespilloides TaxID=110193 RepID=A0ABM1MUY5_NICVS|nr:PREDICTED: uncharacterized protein LOC108564026 [Nicrophorus vespilloides]